MDGSSFLPDLLPIIQVVVALLILVLELRWAAWPLYRAGIITTLAVVFQTVILVGVTAIACASLLAAPLVGRKARTAAASINIEAKAIPDPEQKNP